MSTPSSNIRVFVTFKEPTVFAGEEVEAVITFRNVQPARPKLQRPTLNLNSSRNGSQTHSRATSQAPSARLPLSRQNSTKETLPRRPPPLNNPRHRPTASLNIVENEYHNTYAPRSARSAGPGVHIAEPSPSLPQTHNRSISIISIGSDTNSVDRRHWTSNSPRPSRPAFKHGRSASLQMSPGTVARSPSLSKSAPTPSLDLHLMSLPDSRPNYQSPMSSAASPRFRSAESYFSQKELHRGGLESYPASPADVMQSNFQFPAGPKRPVPSRGNTVAGFTPAHSRSTSLAKRPKSPPGRPKAQREPSKIEVAPATRVLSLVSADETPRTSTDFYSLSNLSDETLASDYPPQASARALPGSFLGRKSSTRVPPRPNVPEDLMMGYVQLTGNFTIDGSLVNQGPFEEVKRKAVVGGQGGGGVVGIERPKASNGLFGSFGWSSIGESLGGFLGGGEQSSIKEMKDVATSKKVPIISTPKSILFVDLKLNPGESRSYNYSIRLPSSLPPTHRGRAMKVSYQLVVGLQRPASTGHQDIRSVDIPFRVFSGLTSDGDILGHDLLSPYIILREEAQTSIVDASAASSRLRQHARPVPKLAKSPAGEADFTSYINHLLSAPRNPTTNTLLSPTADPEDVLPTSPVGDHAQSPVTRQLPSVRTLIDHAIRLASSAASGEPTAFNIARAGRPIGTLTISRPALRLGDTVHLVMSFSDAHIPCYALDATLESTEAIDPSLAIRSASSVERVTRRIWDRVTEPGFALGWAGRWSGRLKVPWSATPAFLTSGVSCRWVVRVEIVVGVEPGTRYPEPVVDEEDDPEGEEDTISDTASLSTSMSLSQSEQALALPQPSTLPLKSASTGKRSATSSRPRRSKQLSRPKLDRPKVLLEDVGSDERGRHLAPRARVFCESFEVAVPIKVFGAPGGGLGEDGAGAAGVEL